MVMYLSPLFTIKDTPLSIAKFKFIAFEPPLKGVEEIKQSQNVDSLMMPFLLKCQQTTLFGAIQQRPLSTNMFMVTLTMAFMSFSILLMSFPDTLNNIGLSLYYDNSPIIHYVLLTMQYTVHDE